MGSGCSDAKAKEIAKKNIATWLKEWVEADDKVSEESKKTLSAEKLKKAKLMKCPNDDCVCPDIKTLLKNEADAQTPKNIYTYLAEESDWNKIGLTKYVPSDGGTQAPSTSTLADALKSQLSVAKANETTPKMLTNAEWNKLGLLICPNSTCVLSDGCSEAELCSKNGWLKKDEIEKTYTLKANCKTECESITDLQIAYTKLKDDKDDIEKNYKALVYKVNKAIDAYIALLESCKYAFSTTNLITNDAKLWKNDGSDTSRKRAYNTVSTLYNENEWFKDVVAKTDTDFKTFDCWTSMSSHTYTKKLTKPSEYFFQQSSKVNSDSYKQVFVDIITLWIECAKKQKIAESFSHVRRSKPYLTVSSLATIIVICIALMFVAAFVRYRVFDNHNECDVCELDNWN